MAKRRCSTFGVAVVGVAMAAVAACATPPPAAGGPATSPPVASIQQLECPASVPAVSGKGVDRYPGWVPTMPVGLDGSDRLVPQDTPAKALLCRYAVKQNSGDVPSGARDRLDGQASLTGDLTPLADELTWTPRPPAGVIGPQACTLMGGPMRTYLAGLSYSDGRVVWVHGVQEPNGCTIGTNGRFVADLDLGSRLAEAFAAKAWRPLLASGQQPDCGPNAWRAFRGRLGDHTQLVPDGSPDVTVCSSAGSVQLTSEQARPVIDALRAVATQPHPGSYSCSGHQDERRLLIRYPQGPGVGINVNPACNLAVTGRRVAAVDQERTLFRALQDATKIVVGPASGTR